MFREFFDDCMRWVRRTSVRKDEILFEENQPSDAIFVLVTGQLEQFSVGGDGRQTSFGIIGSGELVGVERPRGCQDSEGRIHCVLRLAGKECLEAVAVWM